jgi:hypothetical protein
MMCGRGAKGLVHGVGWRLLECGEVWVLEWAVMEGDPWGCWRGFALVIVGGDFGAPLFDNETHFLLCERPVERFFSPP